MKTSILPKLGSDRSAVVVIISICMILGLVLAACGQAGGPPPENKGAVQEPVSTETSSESGPTQEEIVLRFPTWQQDEPGVSEWWKQAIAQFESDHPGVKIEFTKVSHEDYGDLLITQFAGGNPPDIFHVPAVLYPHFSAEGWLEPLDDRLTETDVDVNTWGGQKFCIQEEGTDCIMLFYYGSALAYNDAMLKDAGLSVPTNWEEFLNAARKLTKDTDGDGQIDQFGLTFQNTPGTRILTEVLNFVLDAGGNWTDENGIVTIDTPNTIEGLSRWKILLEENLMPLDTDYSKGRQLFIEGKVAMTVDGPAIWGFIQQSADDIRPSLKIAPSPFTPPVGGESNVIAIPKAISPERKELVWDFISMLVTPEWQQKYALAVMAPAPRPGSTPENIEEVLPYFNIFANAMEKASEAGISRVPIGLEPDLNEFAKALSEATQEMIINDKPADAVAKDLQAIAVELQSDNN